MKKLNKMEKIENIENIENAKLINLTPHSLTLLDEKNNIILTLESQGVIRLETKVKQIDTINGIPITETKFKKCKLPRKKKNTFYIVSLPVAQYTKQQGRGDFLIPGEIVRTKDRKTILGMKSLAIL